MATKTDETARKKLIDSAMLALSPAAEDELAREFETLKERLDTVVRSEAAQGEAPAGPIHAGIHRVLLPKDAEERSAEDPQSVRGSALLRQAERLDGNFAVVPRVV